MKIHSANGPYPIRLTAVEDVCQTGSFASSFCAQVSGNIKIMDPLATCLRNRSAAKAARIEEVKAELDLKESPTREMLVPGGCYHGGSQPSLMG